MNETKDSAVYDAFADIYDQVMRDVDYASWAQHIANLVKRFKIRGKKLLELACGSGSMAVQLDRKGFHVTGIDRSEAMLRHAQLKAALLDCQIPLYKADMESFSSLGLERDFDLVTCLYDSMNYLLEETKIVSTFQEVYNHLRPGGGFIFDVTTEYNLLYNFAGFTFAENLENASYIWENEYDIVKKECSSKVTVFTNRAGKYEKYVELHVQRIYSNQFITDTLQTAGFELLGMFHDMTEEPVQTKCERIHFVCKKIRG